MDFYRIIDAPTNTHMAQVNNYYTIHRIAVPIVGEKSTPSTFDFWDGPGEDIYDENDGEPIRLP